MALLTNQPDHDDDNSQSTGLQWAAIGIAQFGEAARSLAEVIGAVLWTMPSRIVWGALLILAGLFRHIVETLYRSLVALLLATRRALQFLWRTFVRLITGTTSLAKRLSRNPVALILSALVAASILVLSISIKRGGDPSRAFGGDVAFYAAAGAALIVSVIAAILLVQFIIRTIVHGTLWIVTSTWSALRFVWRSLPDVVRAAIIWMLWFLQLAGLTFLVVASVVVAFLSLPPNYRLPVAIAAVVATAAAVAIWFFIRMFGRAIASATATFFRGVRTATNRVVRVCARAFSVMLTAVRRVLRFFVSVKKSADGWNVSFFSLEVLSKSSQTISLFSVSILSFSTQSLAVVSAAFLLCISVLSVSWFTLNVALPWLEQRQQADTVVITSADGVADTGNSAAAPSGVHEVAAQGEAKEFTAEEFAAALVPLTPGFSAAWEFDRSDSFRLVGAEPASPPRISDLLERDICSLGVAIAYGSASSDGRRAHNEELALRRSRSLGELAVEEAARCEGGGPAVLAVALGQSLAEVPDPFQRRVQLIGLAKSDLSRVGAEALSEPRALLVKTSELSGSPSPDDFSSFAVCSLGPATGASSAIVENIVLCGKSP